MTPTRVRLPYLVPLAAALGCASVPPTAGASATEVASGPATLTDLSWLSGYWVGQREGVHTEECWLAPAGGMMLGVHRDSSSERGSFELLRIETTEHGLVYLASPGGRPPTPFRLTGVSAKSARFENPAHDYPTAIVYRLVAPDVLYARIEGERDGKLRTQEWLWRRERLPGP